jgi:hypothetical protein
MSLIKGTLLGNERVFPSVSHLTLDGFSWNFIPRILHAWCKKIWFLWRSVNNDTLSESSVPFPIYLDFLSTDFRETTYLALSNYGLQTLWIWLRLISNYRYFFGEQSTCLIRVFRYEFASCFIVCIFVYDFLSFCYVIGVFKRLECLILESSNKNGVKSL